VPELELDVCQILAVLYRGGEAAKKEPRLLGTIENKLGIADWLKESGHQLIVTDDKDGPQSVFQKEIVDSDILITTPFHPGYLTKEIFAKAPKLRLAVTAGVGSDHIDLNAAIEHNTTVVEVSGSNVVSVAEHAVMSILLLVRNFVPAHQIIERGDWQVSDIARNAFDLEGKVVGTIGAGRIGYRVLERLVPFNCKELLYYDYNPLTPELEKKVGVRHIEDLSDFLSYCDVITVNCPLHEGTRDLLNKHTLSRTKQGVWIVNTARGAVCNAGAIAEGLKSGHINGYAGDVWNHQPAPKNHVWRTMKNPLGGGNGMVPHYSGTTLDAQQRYAEGVRNILERYFAGKKQEPQNLIVQGGAYATTAYGQH